MAVKTNITINVVEPGSSTPVDPTPIDPIPVDPTTNTTIDISVPDTGLFTHGIGAPEATIITITSIVLLLTVLATIVTVLYRKHTKHGKVTKLVHIVDQTKAVIKSKKRTTAGLAAISLLVSAGTLAALLANSGKNNTSAIEGGTELTVKTTSDDLTIEVGDTPVFAYLPVQVTVEEATQTGYTLSAYAENTNLVSTTDESNIIPMVAANEDELVALAENTYGLSLTKPESKDNTIYTSLSTDQSNPTILKTIDDYSETEANDTTTIYYGFYITPDIPYGTYTGGEVEYEAEENKVATVTFDGNGLYFNNDPNQTQNVVKFIPGSIGETKYSHTSNLNDAGEVIDYSSFYSKMYPTNTSETLVYEFPSTDWIYFDLVKSESDRCGVQEGDTTFFSFWPGTHPDYTAEINYDTSIKAFGSITGKYEFGLYPRTNVEAGTTIEENSLTFAYTIGSGDAVYYEAGGNSSTRGCSSGYGYYAVITGYDPHTAISSDYEIPDSNVSHSFLGWSTDPDATMAMYSMDDILNPVTFDVNNVSGITLYAIWTPVPFNISYSGNGATAGSMDSMDASSGSIVTLKHEGTVIGDTVSLYAPNYKKDGYGFVGWSQDNNAWVHLTNEDNADDPIIYGPNQTIEITRDIVMSSIDTNNVTLYAVWAPAEMSDGDPVALQGWTGCSTLAPTRYDTSTGALSVGKNTITALTDSRDGNVYTIARLADGNCWMTENLRLDNSATYASTTSEFSAENTNNPSLPLTNVYSSTTSNRLTTSSNGWCKSSNPDCYNKSDINNMNTKGTVARYDSNYGYDNSNQYQWYSYGNYYNWYSVTAGNGKYETENGITTAGDICPAGWHLPYGGNSTSEKGGNTSGGFYYLSQRMGSDSSNSYISRMQNSRTWRSFPNNFILAGSWGGSSSEARGRNVHYWSSTSYSRNAAYTFRVNDSAEFGIDNLPKYYGLSARCLVPAQ